MPEGGGASKMQQQRQVFGASDKQIALMERLQEEGWLRTDLKFEGMSPMEASRIIATAIELKKSAKEGRVVEEEVMKLADDEHVISKEVPRKQEATKLNYMRFGMCVKLTYPKHNIATGPGLINFRKEVRQLYEAVSNLEQEMAAN